MPSGFRQDTNQLSPTFYRVVWVANTGTYPTADGNTNGAITPNSSDSFATADLPTTLVKGKARARGNMRFNNVVRRLSNLADCQILDIEVGGEANGNAQATSLAFTVKFDRSAGVIDAQKALNVQETTAPGVPGVSTNVAGVAITTIELALEDAVVRGFRDATTYLSRVYDGALGTDNQISLTVAAPDDAADILADVTVTAIDGTELVTLDNADAAE
jgi:hypothetical protein